MRSASSSSRRLRSRPSRHRKVDAIARLVDESTVDAVGHVLVHVADETDVDFALGLCPLDAGEHPFNALAGSIAPADWTMVGVRATGTAHHLDGGRPSARVATTYLLTRDGEEASIIRSSDEVIEVRDRSVGTLPDACRRVLGLPTAPAPASTGSLFVVAWLDRLLELQASGTTAGARSSWAHLAALHPAVRAVPDHDLLRLDDPHRLVTVARAHAAAWSWSRLRTEPDALELPSGNLPADVTSWMDDGFYARWAFGAFPAPGDLVRDVCSLLPTELAGRLVDALAELLP